MEAFHSAQLNVKKQPTLFENESIVLSVENVSIYEGDQLTNYQKGTISITSVRIIWYNSNVSIGLFHDSVVSVESINAGFLSMGSSPKLSVLCRNSKHIKLSFHSGTTKRDEFYRLYKQLLFESQEAKRLQQQQLQQQKQMQQQQQQQSSPLFNNNNNKPTNNVNTNFDTSNAGISGLIKQMNQRQEATDKALTEAFADLGALMDKAKEMVTLSSQLKATIDRQQQAGSNSSDEDTLRQFLVEMGIAVPVTKKTAKSHYHTELSKQLSEWLVSKQILTSKGTGVGSLSSGMITLADLYCLFNRARGIELISPDDLYRACLLFEQLELPVRLRKFDSGVMVVQSKDESDDQVAQEILNLIKEVGGSITAFHLSKLQQISLNLAKEKLLQCEKLERLCRDETIEGISFQENIFI